MVDFELELDIETNTVCQARCAFCPYPSIHHERIPAKPMPMWLFEKIINDAATIPPIRMIRLNGLNEPLLDPLIVDRYAYLQTFGDRFHRALYTNGVMLTPPRLDALRAAGVNTFVVSLNATNPDQHFAIMGLKNKYDWVVANIENAIHSGANVEVHAVCNDDTFGPDSQRAFIDRWGHKRYGGYGILVRELNWTGDNRTVRQFDPNDWCVRATNQVFVRHDGVVTTCCADPLGKGYIWGDLKTQTIRDVYNSGAWANFREDHSLNRASKHAICAKCTRA